MNENAVKQLTEIGCMVESEAAEILNEDDVEQIRNLETRPMYVSRGMVEKLREKIEAKEETVEEEAYEETGEKFSPSKTVELRDSGRRDELTTKVEIEDESEVSKSEKDVPEFLGTFNDRYEQMKDLLMRRRELRSSTTIQRLQRKDQGDDATMIGLVRDVYSTSTDKYILELEDKTGSIKVLVEERVGQSVVEDEALGVTGSMGGDIIYADKVIRPEVPIPDGTRTTEQQVEAAYISDLHIGSKDTLHRRMDRFADWLSTDAASNIGYLVITGDIVEGVGVYPGQEEELEINDLYKQYEAFEAWFKKIPEDIQVVVGPGNHDITRLAEPQPRIDPDVFSEITGYSNFHRVQNPQTLRLHGVESKGIRHLMYHGFSFDDHADKIKKLRESGHENPEKIMIDLLKRRHLAPTFGSNQMAPEGTDPLVIKEKPDVFVSGHLHSHANSTYKGVNVICSSTFQSQTDFQKRVGHQPDPGKVTLLDFSTRKTEVKQF